MQILDIFKDMQDRAGRNRLVVVLDGMGVSVVNNNLAPDGFFRAHMTDIAHAIIPATTVAATTAYRTGKMPYQTGFIGWTQYFSETDEVVEVFRNTNYYTGAPAKLTLPSYTLSCPTVVAQMRAAGRPAFEIMPSFMPGGCATYYEWLSKIVATCNRETDAYIYAYWAQPDSLLHRVGTDDASVRTLLRGMESDMRSALARVKNATDVMITADHGHRNAGYFMVDEYPDFMKCLAHPLSIESRCASLFVRPEYRGRFPEIFDRHFGAHFHLVEKVRFERDFLAADTPVRFVGDFVALATGDYGLAQKRAHKKEQHKSNHAGLTPDELQIPIIRLTTGRVRG